MTRAKDVCKLLHMQVYMLSDSQVWIHYMVKVASYYDARVLQQCHRCALDPPKVSALRVQREFEQHRFSTAPPKKICHNFDELLRGTFALYIVVVSQSSCCNFEK